MTTISREPVDSSFIVALIDKYMRMLGLSGEGPVVEVKDNLGSRWLGRTTLRGGRIWIEVQARAMVDPATFEKILAHEMVHYADMSTLDAGELTLLKFGVGDAEHGKKFWRLAEIVNGEMGAGYVGEKSDPSYELGENTRPFFVVAERVRVGRDRYRLGWRWAAKRTPAIDAIINKISVGGGVLFESTDERFLTGTKMRKGEIGCSLTEEGSELEAELAQVLGDERA